MKWGLQHVKVTLEERESGETVVIEQSSDGRVTCERGDASKRERAANTRPQRAASAKAETPAKTEADPKRESGEAPAKPSAQRKRESEEAPAKPKGQRKRESEEAPAKPKTQRARANEDTSRVKADAEPRAKTGADSEAPSATKPRIEGEAPAPKPRPKSLQWEPCVDHDYHGFAAPSGAGRYKVLISKDSQWALFYELPGNWPKHLGCFRKVEQGKKRAQELHDKRPPDEFGPITAGQIARACPAPRGKDDEETAEAEETPAASKPARAEKPRTRRATPRAEEKPAASKPEETPAAPEPEVKPAEPEPKGPSKTEAEQDKELLGSFAGELNKTLDEEEDD